MNNIFKILLLASFIFSSGCIKKIYELKQSTVQDNKYDSEFPNKPFSKDLEEILTSVKLINSISTYESFDFDTNSFVTKDILSDSTIEAHMIEKRYLNKPATGTATIVYYSDYRIGLITCAHIVDSPDTVINYFTDKRGIKLKYIRNLSLKVRQTINVLKLPEITNFKIIAIDIKGDIAFIGRKFSIKPVFPIPILKTAIGSAEELSWGNIVYLFGYPRGTKLISNCLVSNPNRDHYHSFIINGVATRGISGGPIFAIRDGVPNFELVGMARAVAAENKYYLSPGEDYNTAKYDIARPFTEDIFVELHEMVHYGILYTVSIESILDFLERNESNLREDGYYLDQLLK